MLMTVTPLPTPNDARHLHPHPPPPCLPKPGKENIRLQKVLQKAAKKKNPPAAVAQPKAFRSTLSPVSEASPDLEHCERTLPPRPTTPRPATPRPITPSFLGLSLPPRFFIKPVVHHVSSPYPQHRQFTFTVSEQRSLSECLRRTPSPRPPSPSVKQVIPPLQLPKSKADVPSQGLVPASPVHLTHPIPVIVEPVAPFVRTPAQSTPVVEITVQEVQVNDAQPLLPEAVSLQQGSTISESVQKTPIRKDDSNHTVVCQSKPSNMVSTTVTTLHIMTNAALPKTTQDTASTHPPKNESTMESAQGPRTPSIQLNTPSTPNDSSNLQPVPDTRPQTPKQQDTLTTQQNDAQMVQVTITPQTSNTVAKTEVPPAPPVLPPKSEPTITEVPKSEPLLKPAEKVKPPRTKLSGWSRLKKHLVVEPEEPTFPVPEPEAPNLIGDAVKENKEGKDGEEKGMENKTTKPKESRANKMWDALLYQMCKEEDKKKEDKETGEGKSSAKEEKPSFFFRCRLPLLLYRPRFDARKLREAASRPLKKITTMFDLGRLNRKAPEEEPKDFNRTASGWQLK